MGGDVDGCKTYVKWPGATPTAALRRYTKTHAMCKRVLQKGGKLELTCGRLQDICQSVAARYDVAWGLGQCCKRMHTACKRVVQTAKSGSKREARELLFC